MTSSIVTEINQFTSLIEQAHTPAEKLQALETVKGRMLRVVHSAPTGSDRWKSATRMIREIEKKIDDFKLLNPMAIPAAPSKVLPASTGSGRKKEQSDEEDIMSLIDVFQPDEIPDHRSLEDLQLYEEDKKRIFKRIIDPFLCPELRAGGIKPTSAFLFGPAGTGKTSIAQIVAREAKAILVVVNGAVIKGRYYGQSQARLKKILDYVNELSQTHAVVLLFDECDALLGRTNHAAGRDIISTFLTGMDGVGHKAAQRAFSVICATNKPEAFDEQVVRRLKTMLYVGPPNAEQRYKFLENQIGQLPAISPDLDLTQLARDTRGYSCADLERILEEANAERIDDSVRPRRFLPLTNEHLEMARRKTIPTLRDDVIAPYEKFAAKREMTLPQFD